MTSVTCSGIELLPDLVLSSNGSGQLEINGVPIPTPTSEFESVTLIPGVVLTSSGDGRLEINGVPLPEPSDEFDSITLLPDVVLTSNGSGELQINGQPIPTTNEFNEVILLPDITLSSNGNEELEINGTVVIDQPITTTSNVTFNDVSATVDGVDVSSLNSQVQNIQTDINEYPDELKNLTTTEIQQLENIGSTTISSTQWGYLGSMNQGVATTDNVQFNKVQISNDSNINWGGGAENTRIAGNATNLSLNSTTAIELNTPNVIISNNLNVAGTTGTTSISSGNATVMTRITSSTADVPWEVLRMKVKNNETTLANGLGTALTFYNENTDTPTSTSSLNGSITCTMQNNSVTTGNISIIPRNASTEVPFTFSYLGNLTVPGSITCSSIIGSVDPLPFRDNLAFDNNEGIRWGSTSCQITGTPSGNVITLTGTNVDVVGTERFRNANKILFDNTVNVGSVALQNAEIATSQNGLQFVNAAGNPVMGIDGASVGATRPVYMYGLSTGGSSFAPMHCNVATGLVMVDTSSERHKTNIQPVNNSFDTSKIYKLKAKAYDRVDGPRQMGFIAEEFVQHFPMMTYMNRDGQVEGINYSYLTVPIINEMQKMRREMELMREEIVTLRSIIEQ